MGGGESMWYVVLASGLLLACWKWWLYKVAALSLIAYIEKKNYTQPTEEEIAECNRFVIKNLLNDMGLN